MQRAETVTVDERTRISLNGETKAMMDHVQTKWKKSCYDTSVDQPWSVDPTLAWHDWYVKVMTVLWFPFKLPALFPMLILMVVAVLPAWLYGRSQLAPTDRLRRTPVFWAVFTLSLVLFLPNLFLVLACLAVDYFIYYVFGLLFTACTWRWGRCWNAHRVLDPYRHGPSLLLAAPDIFACVVGQSLRHGFLGTSWNVTLMCLVMPWAKYWWNANPWVYDLDERYVQQISTSMKDLAEIYTRKRPNPEAVDLGICNTARRIISRCRQFAFLRKNEDLWNFAPHYPYPPEHRRWAVGMQVLLLDA
jgi:hypothetical protein